jgi:hypothetical protein
MLIDKFSPDWLQQLESWVQSLQADEHIFLLLDTAFTPGLHRALAAAVPAEQAPRLLFESLPSCDASTQDVSPALLPFLSNDAQNPKLRQALLRCDGWPMVHAIITSESLQELGQRLEKWCVVEADGQRFNFRFPDVRRLPGIFSHLTAEQRAHLVGPAKAWHRVGRDGHWQRLDGLPVAPAVDPLDTRLSAVQFAAMVDDSEADGILTILADRGLRWQQPHSEVFALVTAALHVAHGQALDEGTRIDWCEACLRDHTLLHDQPLAHLQRWLAPDSP